MISRFMNVEVSGDPREVNSIGATGIAQWLGPCKKRLRQIAQQRGVPWNDFDLQLGLVIEELNNGEWRAGDRLRSAKSAEEGTIGGRGQIPSLKAQPNRAPSNFSHRLEGSFL